MVLESLIPAREAFHRKRDIFILTVVFVTIGIFAALFIQTGDVSLLTIAFVTIPCVPLVLNWFNYEEILCEEHNTGFQTIFRHLPLIIVLITFFFGLIVGFILWNALLPADVNARVFSLQNNELNAIHSSVPQQSAGSGSFLSAFATENRTIALFERIFFNNLVVLGLILLSSIIYGAGAAFILIWNASIISVFMVDFAKSNPVSELVGVPGFIVGLLYAFVGLIPHGFFELLAYLVCALAGGIISSAIVRRYYGNRLFIVLLYDVVKLVSWAVLFVAIGAFIESQAMAS